jgi:hypothetical protein
MLIDELLNRSRLEKLLRDSYGNYCVQTALDYSDPAQRAALVDGIRPVLPLIRNTPYGKRIQNKLQREHLDQFGSTGGGGGGGYAGHAGMSPHSNNRGLPSMQRGGAQNNDMYGAQNGMYGQGGLGGGLGGMDPYYSQRNGQSFGGQGGYQAYSNSGGFNATSPAPYQQRQTYGYGM